ncbi:MAG TPA: ATP-binding protein [Candidatus Binatia bacterium]|nr:ATP-binding protein [Candidatus Binatia bacterium]
MKRPWNNRLIYTFFLSYLAIIILLSVGFFLYSSKLLRDFHFSSLGKVMEQKTQVLTRLLPWQDEPGSLDAVCRTLADELGVRITVIASDGTVIGDSDEPAIHLENHGSRPEVIEAFSRGTGSAVRYSTSVKHNLFYRAYRQNAGSRQRIVRVSVSFNEVENVTASLGRTLLVGVLLCAFLGLGVAYFFSRRVSNRINRLAEFSKSVADGRFAQPVLPRMGDDELDVLEQNLYDMSLKIRDTINELRSEKEKVDSILGCMVEGLVVIGPKGRVLLINEQAKTMFGVSEEQIRDGSFVEISRSPEMRTILREISAFDFSKNTYSKRISVEDRWFRVHAVSLRNGTEQVSGSILVFHDITEIQRLETVRSDFVANVSHELRTPLTAIRGYVETLLHNPPADPADAKQFLTIIDRHSERLSRLTEDLLVLSDLESGARKMTFKPVEAGHLIQRVLEVFWDRAGKKNVTLSYSFSSGLPLILGDYDRLQQLFINLVDNAVKYTASGGSVTITAAHAHFSVQADAWVEIAVADTGAGIAEKDLPRLTERFYRVDKARSRELGGTGLGLAIVKHIVQAHGGELKIESVINRGTTVRVLLPGVAAQKNPDATLFICTGNSCRSQMAEGFARQLVRAGHRVYSAGTAPKEIHPMAIQVMKEVGIDISGQRSKGIESIPLNQIQRIVTLCGEAAESCPTLSEKVERIHWSLPDPALQQGDEARVLQAFRDVRDSIRFQVHNLLLIPTSQSISDSHLN